MIDLKKVIKGLECCLDDYGIDSNCSECPYAEKDVGSDLISRRALLAAYDAAHKGPPGGARKLIEEAPGVDAAPVVHGRWVHHKGGYSDHYECTVCGEGIVLTARFRYCSNCGAKMDGDENAVD